ncbi:MAG: response regulator transcription factor [Lachnospiraceae bacterium]|nr:response regulator transcription factor [Lachnospiraceae bacterium]
MKLCDKVKLLLIDEDTNMHCLIKNLLNQANYKIYEADNGTMGIQLSTSLCPDIVLLDLKLRDMNGIEIIKCIREWSDCPIIVISESDGVAGKVKALYTGADDYIVKPFNNQELKARIYSVLRRRGSSGHTHPYKAKDLEIDFDRRLVTVRNQEIHFPPIEYRILEQLALNAGTVVTYKMLLQKIWGPYTNGNSRILRVNMTNIRKKIEKIPTSPEYIYTISRVGYRMIENQISAGI